MPEQDSPEREDDTSLTFLQMLGSTLAAAFGVQSSRNRSRDFSRGRATHFIAMGILFTAVFVLVIVAVVNWVLG